MWETDRKSQGLLVSALCVLIISMAPRLLVHITFHDSNVSTVHGRPAGGSKGSLSWRDFAFDSVRRSLQEMESASAGYSAFSRIDAVVDCNEENAYQERLRRWRADRPDGSRLSVRVASHARDAMRHPFALAWMHRAHVAASLEQYDWFLNTEADTLVPGAAVAAQLALASPLYERYGRILGFVRAVNDTSGRTLLSDNTRSVGRAAVVSLSGLGTFVAPPNSFAAAWMYPRAVMTSFVRSRSWGPVPNSPKGMRERAAWGWRDGPAILTPVELIRGRLLGELGVSCPLLIYHLGKSGRFYERKGGHNILPAEQLVAECATITDARAKAACSASERAIPPEPRTRSGASSRRKRRRSPPPSGAARAARPRASRPQRCPPTPRR